jgi:hypothetical protein
MPPHSHAGGHLRAFEAQAEYAVPLEAGAVRVDAISSSKN